MILAPSDIPLKQFPTSANTYERDLKDWLASLIDQGYRYTGSISKVVGKQTFTVHTFSEDSSITEVLVLNSSLAGILNFPTSDKSLAKSASEKFQSLEKEGWVYSGSYFKRISTSNYTFLVFYRHKKPRRKSIQTGSTSEE